ncbi:hypothetical protein PFICI_02102 [Pestalotiopsis fici W106-1]|uniref:Uncharacterized protein n=1 Tax=Pestalotiopsis fici (strain W106-1 / CGMCC3.15140) TaxID=1229662 RepID=W3XQK7_PESFW|nr:uncharacterized protein PFICI_02102 [Pestalotiopsis fici W106-1]ETS88274.1 hypothetical protein PFICI_02102 [Pestalotiopsis fici W106-1]
MNLCKDRHNDIIRSQRFQPRREIDDLGRVMHRWACIMIRRNAHKTLQSGGDDFWLSFGGMVRQALNQVIGSGIKTDAVISKIKAWATAEKDATERGHESAGSKRVTTPAVLGDKRKRNG